MTDALVLEAGPELDLLIAERVMKLELCSCGCTIPYGDSGCPNCKKLRKPPLYSTDIAAAWQIVDRLRQIVAERHVAPSWPAQRIEIYWDGSLQSYRVIVPCYADKSASTAPLAICRAALKAVGA